MSEIHYVDYMTIQNIIQNSWLEKKRPLTVEKVRQMLSPEDFPTQKKIIRPNHILWGNLSDQEFETLIKQAQFILDDHPENYMGPSGLVFDEETIFSSTPYHGSIRVMRHFHYTWEAFHQNSYFELTFVFWGNCTIRLEDRELELCSGDVCIIAPNTRHAVDVSDGASFLLDISIKASTFEELFFSQLSQNNLLSLFFRNAIYDHISPNFILFHTGEDSDIRKMLKNITMENHFEDAYHQIVSISWSNIFFSLLLRKYHSTVQYFNYSNKSDFPLVLQYIQSHYQTVTLDELAAFFNYTKPYMCNLLKQNTSHTFSELVNLQKTGKAADMLKYTQFTIDRIAELTGYSSPDYFTKTFKKLYGCTPMEYRKKNRIS